MSNTEQTSEVSAPPSKSWFRRFFGGEEKIDEPSEDISKPDNSANNLERKTIEEKLITRTWWQNTSLSLQWYLKSLPENCNGALRQLAEREEEGGGVRLVRLVSVNVPNYPGGPPFGILVNFEVQKIQDPSITYCYQYHLWKQGPKSGSKGIILVKDGEKISHIVCLKGFAFASGKETHDTVGGFRDNPNHTPEEAMIRELHEELNIPPSSVIEAINLGDIFPDRGQTATNTDLIALVVDISVPENIDADHENADLFEMNSNMVMVPIEDLWGADGFLMENKDSYFSVCVARLISLGILAPPSQ